MTNEELTTKVKELEDEINIMKLVYEKNFNILKNGIENVIDMLCGRYDKL
jgi:hypothetical protein